MFHKEHSRWQKGNNGDFLQPGGENRQPLGFSELHFRARGRTRLATSGPWLSNESNKETKSMEFASCGLGKYVVALVLGTGLSLSLASATPQDGPASPVTDLARSAEELKNKKSRIREGAKVVDAVGTFQWIGDRLSFHANPEEGGLKILENRMMERVVQTQENSTGELEWVVTGTVTEYRGSNFLLLTHVILKGKRND